MRLWLTIAGVAFAVALYSLMALQISAQQARIDELTTRAKGARADATAIEERLRDGDRIEIEYRDIVREVESSGPSSEACLSDPRLGRAYESINERRRVRSDGVP